MKACRLGLIASTLAEATQGPGGGWLVRVGNSAAPWTFFDSTSGLQGADQCTVFQIVAAAYSECLMLIGYPPGLALSGDYAALAPSVPAFALPHDWPTWGPSGYSYCVLAHWLDITVNECRALFAPNAWASGLPWEPLHLDENSAPLDVARNIAKFITWRTVEDQAPHIDDGRDTTPATFADLGIPMDCWDNLTEKAIALMTPEQARERWIIVQDQMTLKRIESEHLKRKAGFE